MLNFSGVRIRNLRALADTDWVDLRSINILVGKNSAGKSSFARVFPLLKQSAERRKQAPLLWYGRLVDFGSFADVVSSFAEPAEIELGFRFRSRPALHLSRRAYIQMPRQQRPVEEETELSESTIVLAETADGRTHLKRFHLKFLDVAVVGTFEGSQSEFLEVAGQRVTIPPEMRLAWVQGAVLPQLRVISRESASIRVSDEDFTAPRRRTRLGEEAVIDAISHFVHGNTLRERKLEIADRLPIATLAELHRHCRELTGTPDTWRTNISAASPHGFWFERLHRALLLYKLDLVLAELDDALSSFCDSVSYLEPLRATAQRYYRREEVSVDELDPKGLNTAFYIQGLTQRERDSLNGWLLETLGFQLKVIADRGHAALHVGVDGLTRNMADVGLGYSQIAPVAIQLWAARQPRRSVAVNRGRVSGVDRRAAQVPLVVVEQPELHLHPAFQAKLADIFSACTRASESDLFDSSVARMRLIAETHSQSLVSRLGELVGDGTIQPDQVNVLVFEPHASIPGASSIRRVEFDEQGVLRNWPIGFFDY
jgi:hypothetical protein